MKKLISLALAVVIVLAFAACGKKEPQTAVITFPSNPTTGYTWNVFQSSDLFEISSEYTESKNSEGLVGAGGTETFTLTPLKAGECEVSFVYQRPWEAMELGDTYTYYVTVSKDMQIKVTGSAASVAGTMDELPAVPDFTIN